jgi:Uma2 family endonuclease
MAFETSIKLTYDDYLVLPDDGRRYQIIDGELYVNPAPVTKHQIVALKLAGRLDAFVEEHSLGQVMIAPVDVLLSVTDIVQPDILFVSRERQAIITDANVKGAPDLVIEILSDSTRKLDEISKRQRYEWAGVSEYWIVDPMVEVVRIYRRGAAGFERAAEVSVETGGALTSPLLPGLSLDIAAIFPPG